MSKCNDTNIIHLASEKFDHYIEKGVEIVPDLRRVYFGVVARQNQKETIKKFQKVFKTVGFSEVERDCIGGKLFNFLMLKKDETHSRRQNIADDYNFFL